MLILLCLIHCAALMKLVDGLVAVPGNDALIVPDGDLLTDAAKFVHDLPQSVALKHEYESSHAFCWYVRHWVCSTVRIQRGHTNKDWQR